jgi:hypothetical protein
MKRCPRCCQEKPRAEFTSNVSRDDGLQVYCLSCMRAYRREHYKNNKGPYIERARRQGRNVREIVKRTKQAFGICLDCRQEWPWYVLQYDHRPGEMKLMKVGRASTLNQARQEIAKCDIVCANCHAERTWQRKHWERGVTSNIPVSKTAS